MTSCRMAARCWDDRAPTPRLCTQASGYGRFALLKRTRRDWYWKRNVTGVIVLAGSPPKGTEPSYRPLGGRPGRGGAPQTTLTPARYLHLSCRPKTHPNQSPQTNLNIHTRRRPQCPSKPGPASPRTHTPPRPPTGGPRHRSPTSRPSAGTSSRASSRGARRPPRRRPGPGRRRSGSRVALTSSPTRTRLW